MRSPRVSMPTSSTVQPRMGALSARATAPLCARASSERRVPSRKWPLRHPDQPLQDQLGANSGKCGEIFPAVRLRGAGAERAQHGLLDAGAPRARQLHGRAARTARAACRTAPRGWSARRRPAQCGVRRLAQAQVHDAAAVLRIAHSQAAMRAASRSRIGRHAHHHVAGASTRRRVRLRRVPSSTRHARSGWRSCTRRASSRARSEGAIPQQQLARLEPGRHGLRQLTGAHQQGRARRSPAPSRRRTCEP